MAPSYSRLLILTLPTIAVIISYLWFKKKRIQPQSDPGDRPEEVILGEEQKLIQDLKEAAIDITPSSPAAGRSFSRSLSSPIDIIIPRELRTQKTSPVIISDEDLDLEIEKIKSMKNTTFVEPIICRKSQDTVDNPIISPFKSLSLKRSPTKTSNSFVKPIEEEIMKNKTLTKTNTTPCQNMNGKDLVKVEEKLGALKLETKNIDVVKATNKIDNQENRDEELQRQSSERDSANHSPVDVMLASPSLSCISDNHSEGSSDSGKGGSDVAATPPRRTPAPPAVVETSIVQEAVADLPGVYEFVVPQRLVGKLIGRHGQFVKDVKIQTKAHLIIKMHPEKKRLKICLLQGTPCNINKALKMIRERFPQKAYPDLTLEQVVFVSHIPNITTDHLYLKLIEGINNDTIVSCMVTPNHLFLQQPTHPSFPNLHILTNCMNMCYNDAADDISLPKPIQESTICVAESVGQWYRTMIISTDEDADTSYVVFLDYGGYAIVDNSKLLQIRGDFLLLPFQAAECFLANIRPIGGDECGWSQEAYDLVAELTKGAISMTQIADYTEYGIPLVLMYILLGNNQVIYLNDELVNKGFAEYTYFQEHEEVEGAVGGVNA